MPADYTTCKEMPDPSLPQLLFITATFLVAGLVKGVTGMGLPTVAMGLLGVIMPPVAAASVLIVPSFVTNVWQLLSGPGLARLFSRLWTMMAGVAFGTLASAGLLAGGAAWTTTALGGVLVVYALFTLFGRQLSVPASHERWVSPAVGLATGLVTGATGVFVIPAVPYLQALGLPKEDLVQALGLSFTVSTIALALALFLHGALEGPSTMLSFGVVLPALLGMWLGQVVRARVSATTFRRWFLIGLAALGAELLIRPLF